MPGVVSGEMFRNMQNSEIIRRMTEEFDEVTIYPNAIVVLISSNVHERKCNVINDCVFMKLISNKPYCKNKFEFLPKSFY